MMLKTNLYLIALAILVSQIPNNVYGQKVTVDTVIGGLTNPTSVAIQPGTGHVFVCESGAHRVIRIVDGKPENVIVGFEKDFYGKGPLYDIGPLSLLFIERDLLLVGGGGMADGQEKVSLYKVPFAGEKSINADAVEGESMMLPEDEDVPGEGDFYSMTRTGRGIFVTCNGDDKMGWIALAKVGEGKLTSLSRSIATKPETKTNAPVAIAFSPDGYLAVGSMGQTSANKDSVLSFWSPEDGEFLASFKTGSTDLTGLAYGPKRGRLFATDFNWNDTSNGALVKLVGVDEDKCESRLIKPLKKPTSLAFAPNGDLYVTLAGNSSEGAETPDGKLIVIKGLDDAPDDDSN